MDILREQLGALLHLEVKYTARDYLLDLTSRSDEHCGLTSGNANSEDPGNSTISQDQLSPSGKESLRSATVLTEEGEKEEENNDASLPSMAASTNANSTVITEQNAMSWRENICEWYYQGEQNGVHALWFLLVDTCRETRNFSNQCRTVNRNYVVVL
jgi:hypothetical protein